MRRGMEKEEKGLFRSLLDFWREKISGEETDGIGFWKEKTSGEKTDGIGFWNEETKQEEHFAEMGAVDTLSREEVKKVFWGREDEWMEKKQQKVEVFSENPFGDRMEPTEEKEKESLKNEKPQVDFFTAEMFWAKDWEEHHENEMSKMFFSDIDEEEKRMIIPMAEEAKQGDISTEEGLSEAERIVEKRTEKIAEPTVDIENLMRQITRRLWEEREGCGRRLR